jgi:hypothetical protein
MPKNKKTKESQCQYKKPKKPSGSMGFPKNQEKKRKNIPEKKHQKNLIKLIKPKNIPRNLKPQKTKKKAMPIGHISETKNQKLSQKKTNTN